MTAESEDDEAVADITSALSPSLILSPSVAEEPKSSLTIPINRPHGSAHSFGYTNSPLSTSASTVGTGGFPIPMTMNSNTQRSLSINTGSLFHTASQNSITSPIAPLSSSYTNVGSLPGNEFMTAKALLSVDGDTASPLSTSGNSFSALFNRSNKNIPRKPKNSITKTKSSFVSKIITNDQLAKVLSARTSEDAYLFYNVGTSFIWMDAASKPRVCLSYA